MNQKSFLTMIFLTFCWIGLFAQSNDQPTNTSQAKVLNDIKVESSYAKLLGKTKKLRDLVPLAGTPKDRKQDNKKIRQKPANFIGRGKRTVAVNPDARPKGGDPVRQTGFDLTRSPDSILLNEPLLNMDGLTSGSAPNDPSGDIGLNYYIQAVNVTRFRIFDKEGVPVTNPISANTLWSSLGLSSAGDPIILFDQDAQRWIITEFPNGNRLLMAISETSDPTGSFYVYSFQTPSFPDYPKYAVWNNCYSVTTNEGGNGTLHAYFINRQDILDGVDNPRIQRLGLPGIPSGPNFFVATPVDWSGSTAPPADRDPMILRLNDDAWGASANDQIDIFSIDIDWDNEDNTQTSMTSVVSAGFDTGACSASGGGFACVPQMGGSGIDGLPETIMNQPHYRNFGTYESMILNFLVNANTQAEIIGGIRWMEFRRLPGEDWQMYQEGTFSPDDGLHRFNASMAMDGKGNIGMAYNVTSPNSFVGLRYTGRRSSDPLGEMTVIEYNLVEGGSTSNTFGNRWGDYAHMSIDPVDDRTFWFTSEYQGPNNTRTKIVSFQFQRDTIDIGVTALLSPASSFELTENETISIQVKNFGLDTVSEFSVGYILDNGVEVVEPVTFQLSPDSIYNHTFTTTEDFSAIGLYNLKTFTSLAIDAAAFNDTLRSTINQFPRFDAGITGILGLDKIFCADSAMIAFTLANFGGEDLTSATIDISLNGALQDPISWTGTLAMGESATIDYTALGLIDGINEISIFSSSPNGEEDFMMSNDTTSRDFEVELDGVEVILVINLDDYPQETTWTLSDDNGVELATGGPYPNQDFQEIQESFCLDPEACFTFTMFDSYGDGICCGFGFGNYSIIDADGLPLLSRTGEFGAQETSDFCATFACSVSGDIDISPESETGANDGVIMITTINGVGPFMYSIDGGTNFQDNNVFSSLGAGDFDVVIMDIAECDFSATATIETCAIGISATAGNVSAGGTNDGAIEVSAINGLGAIQYSIDGENFTNNNVFESLAPGDYTVFARDSAGCEISLLVTVDMETSLEDVIFGSTVEVLPNPTNGLFRINVIGLDRSDVFLPFHIYDMSGKLVQTSQLVRYNDTYTSEVSLVAYASGAYLIRFLDKNMNRLVKVVKR